MRFLVSTIGSRGEAQPVTALAVRLRDLGNDVTVVAPPDFADLVTGNGIHFVPVGPVLRRAADVDPSQLKALAEQSVRDQFAVLTAAAAGADVLVAGGALQHATRSVAESIGAHYVYASFCANTLPSPHHAPPALLGNVFTNGTPQENLAHWEQQRSLFDFSRDTVNAERAKLDLPPVDDIRDHIFSDTPWLAADPLLSPWPGPGDLVHTGAWLLPDSRPLAPDLQAFLDNGEPPLYLGLGSMSRTTPHIVTDVVHAARLLGKRLVLQRGWADLTPADTTPDHITIDEVNHQSLFRRVAAVIHHGGAGTTTTAAAAGVPQLVLPHMYDQYYWAAQVERLDIGRSGPPTPDTLAETLTLSPQATKISPHIRTDGAHRAATRLMAL
ncbi:hypothetical protein BBK82_23920 [Lentzea guizhouensis]|uniref:Uncharacterized protein n=1 Tax=Lentzea guizhouensis TaxID=1586287 RepID=A0A1B2HLQ4_9PSEU|nr:glycosyltransferase [Lentzea guizhouensis]ANZ38654.1 hypothetical protein BBK82_23920 [Lentzea guizhouensis]